MKKHFFSARSSQYKCGYAPDDFQGNLFTLIELLVVIVIIILLVAILLPALHSAQQRAQATHCINNLKSFGLAVQQYGDDNHGECPINRNNGTATVKELEYYSYLSPYLGGPSTDMILTGEITGYEWISKSLFCKSLDPIEGQEYGTVYGFIYLSAEQPGEFTLYKNQYILDRVSTTSSPVKHQPFRMLIAGDSYGQYGNIGRSHMIGARSDSQGYIRLAHGGNTNLLYLDGRVISRTAQQLRNNEEYRMPSFYSSRFRADKITRCVAVDGTVIY